MKLNDTVELMLSEDYKERFRAEIYQLNVRMIGLEQMLTKYKRGELAFTPKCSYDLLHGQYRAMDLYLQYLCDRAEIEGIELGCSIV
jgi:hypothetical protein